MTDVIDIYRRLQRAYDRGSGLRLSPEEVCTMWCRDPAIQHAIIADDEEAMDRDAAATDEQVVALEAT